MTYFPLWRTISLVLLYLLAISCQGENISVESTAIDSAQAIEAEAPRTAEPPPADLSSPTPPPPPPPPPGGTPPPAARRIIYTADYKMQVADVNQAAGEVQRLVQRYGGYLAASEMQNNRYELSTTLTLRVPVDQFDTLLNGLSRFSTFTDYRNLRTTDVSEEWLDLETRLQTKREVRDRYIDILRNRARSVEDILVAEDKIRVITEEIERHETRLRYLRDQVGFSTINLILYQETDYREAPDTLRRSFGSRLWAALGDGWELLSDLVIGLVSSWPLLLLLFVVGLLVRRFRRRK